ncbi:MAG: hypothetical protein K2Q09_01175 [Phycisphaerales bacterium]|nr:hypothetical protein [Phycisphaerales bacterium]
MSTVIPTNNAELLQWGDDHAPIFTASAQQLGLSAQQATQFASANTAMSNAWQAYNKAQSSLRDAASAWKEARSAFRTLAAADVALIKNYAERQANPEATYSLAQIPAPSPRTPAVPPVAPAELRATLDTQTGAITLRWKAAQPKGINGVVYNVQRIIGAGTGFASVGLTGGKSFTDENIPAGTSRLQYRIVAQRGSLVSPASMTLDVRLSTGSNGEVNIASVKLAA